MCIMLSHNFELDCQNNKNVMKTYKLTVFEILRDFYYYILCICVIPTHRVYQLYGTPPSLLCWTVRVSGCQWLLCSKGLIYTEDGYT